MLFCQHAQSGATASRWLHKGFASIMAAATEWLSTKHLSQSILLMYVFNQPCTLHDTQIAA